MPSRARELMSPLVHWRLKAGGMQKPESIESRSHKASRVLTSTLVEGEGHDGYKRRQNKKAWSHRASSTKLLQDWRHAKIKSFASKPPAVFAFFPWSTIAFAMRPLATLLAFFLAFIALITFITFTAFT